MIDWRSHWLCVQRDMTAERGGAAERLRASEAQLRLALDVGRMAVFNHDFITDDLSHSEEFNRLLGFPPGHQLRMNDLRACFASG